MASGVTEEEGNKKFDKDLANLVRNLVKTNRKKYQKDNYSKNYQTSEMI